MVKLPEDKSVSIETVRPVIDRMCRSRSDIETALDEVDGCIEDLSELGIDSSLIWPVVKAFGLLSDAIEAIDTANETLEKVAQPPRKLGD